MAVAQARAAAEGAARATVPPSDAAAPRLGRADLPSLHVGVLTPGRGAVRDRRRSAAAPHPPAAHRACPASSRPAYQPYRNSPTCCALARRATCSSCSAFTLPAPGSRPTRRGPPAAHLTGSPVGRLEPAGVARHRPTTVKIRTVGTEQSTADHGGQPATADTTSRASGAPPPEPTPRPVPAPPRPAVLAGGTSSLTRQYDPPPERRAHAASTLDRALPAPQCRTCARTRRRSLPDDRLGELDVTRQFRDNIGAPTQPPTATTFTVWD